jgi:putative SOS response-associated peptidase YedK
MPVVLQPDALDVWLSGEELPPDVMRAVLAPYSAEEMIVRPVSRRLNNARYDAPDVLDEDRGPVQQSLGL